jgi:hypothetical protein
VLERHSQTKSLSDASMTFVDVDASNLDPCNKGVYCDSGELVPDPDDCRNFFACDTGFWASYSCGPGSLFDSIKLECVLESDATCQEPCPPSTTLSTMSPLPPGHVIL